MIPSSLEQSILLQCGRARLDEAASASLRRSLEGVSDWEAMIALAEAHGMLPLVAYHAQAVTASSPSLNGVRGSLRTAFMSNAARSLMLASELAAVLGDLRRAGIRVLPYKGPYIALAAYGSLALRRMRDLDLVVARRDVGAAQGILNARGYHQVTRLLPEPLRFRLEYQCLMARESDNALVELHWMIAPPNVAAGPSFEELWSRRIAERFQGVETAAMSPADVMLTLCIHGTKHRWSRLEWIVSVAELLRAASTDWRLVTSLAMQAGASRMVRVGLHLAHDLLAAPIPAELRAWLDADAVAVDLAALAARSLFADPGSARPRELEAFQWRAQEGIGGRLRYLFYWPLIRVGRRTVA